MSLFFKKNKVKDHLKQTNQKNKTIGLIPTMGSLHPGHLSLIQSALKKNDSVWVSIFINPTQFDKKIDLINYPQNLDKDLELIKKISDDINVFIPSKFEMYGEDTVAKVYDFNNLDSELEGKYRKSHFNGVATIVSKFLNLFKPDNIYFGEKDYQQILIIRRLIYLEKINVELVVCPTIREKNGLALSSRNKLLTDKEKNNSSIIYKSLIYVNKNLKKLDIKSIKKNVVDKIEEIKSFQVEYLEIANAQTLEITIPEQNLTKMSKLSTNTSFLSKVYMKTTTLLATT